MPEVTVAMAVYNGSAHLRRSLEAVFGQTASDFEVLVLDDGSTDDSAQIAAEFPVRLLRQPNAGLGSGRQRLTAEAKGDWVAFVDHDDFWTPDHLEVLLSARQPGTVLVHADGEYVYEDGRVEPRDLVSPVADRPWDHILPGNRVIASTALYHRQTMLQAGNFVPDTVRCSDWYGWMILAPHGQFVHVPRRIVSYSVLRTSLANAGFRFHDAQRYLLEQHWIPRADELFQDLSPADQKRYRAMLTANLGLALAGMARKKQAAGEREEAKHLARRALRTAPTVLKVVTRAVSVLARL